MTEENNLSVGAQLRAAREAQGLSLADMQTATKIQANYLTAIENDDFAALPGDFYARAFVRKYAGTLGLDAENLMPSAPASHTQVDLLEDLPTVKRRNQTFTQTAGVWGVRILSVVAVIAVLLGIWWALTNLRGSDTPAQTNLVSVASSAVPTSTSSSAKKASSTASSSSAQMQVATTVQTSASRTVFNITGATKRDFVIDAGAAPIWAQVTSDDGTVLLNQTVAAKQKATIAIPATAKTVTVNFGNTLNVTTKLNGQTLDFKQKAVNPWNLILNFK